MGWKFGGDTGEDTVKHHSLSFYSNNRQKLAQNPGMTKWRIPAGGAALALKIGKLMREENNIASGTYRFIIQFWILIGLLLIAT